MGISECYFEKSVAFPFCLGFPKLELNFEMRMACLCVSMTSYNNPETSSFCDISRQCVCEDTVCKWHLCVLSAGHMCTKLSGSVTMVTYWINCMLHVTVLFTGSREAAEMSIVYSWSVCVKWKMMHVQPTVTECHVASFKMHETWKLFCFYFD